MIKTRKREEKSVTFGFIEDLDEYFCEKYANYDRICILKGYEMPKMQTTERREDGTDYSYTLPASTMRLALQKNREELLRQLKETMTDSTFSYTFRPLGFFARIKENFSKESFKKLLPNVLAKYNTETEDAGKLLEIDAFTWNCICKGRYLPTKNLVFSLSLAAHISLDDACELLSVCGFEFDYALVKDTVVSYLLAKSIFNAEMVKAALEEYKVKNLFIKEL